MSTHLSIPLSRVGLVSKNRSTGWSKWMLMLLMGLLGAQVSYAQVVAWDFSTLTGGTNNFGASPLAPTTTDPGVTAVGLTRGAGMGSTGTGAAKAWGGTNWSTTITTQAGAVTGNQYATFSVTVGTGKVLSLTSIPSYNVRKSASGPATGIWQYSINAGAFTDIGTSITWGAVTTAAGNTEPAITLSGISALQSLAAGTVVTFRVLLWGATGATGTWYLNDPAGTTAADLSLTGTVSNSGGGSSPTVSTSTIGTITANSAVLNGNVTATGSPTSSTDEKGFVYSLTATNAAPAISGTGVTKVTTATGTLTTGAFTSTPSTLAPASNYSYASYATNGTGTSYGTVSTFTTLAAGTAATLTTNAASSVASTSAQLNGTINTIGTPTGASDVKGFVYSSTITTPTLTNFGTGAVTSATGTLSTGAFNNTPSTLTSSTTYYYQAYATNQSGATAYGGVQSFTTSGTATITATFNNTNKLFATTTVASDTASLRVSATGLSADLIVGPTTGYEFATVVAGPYASTQNITPTGGVVSSRKIYVRLAAGNAVGFIKSNIVVTSTGATTRSNPIRGQVYGNPVGFNPSNIVVSVLGDSGYNQSSVSTPFFLYELSKTGTYAQTVALPFVKDGANKRVNVAGGSTTSAGLNLSPDGKYLVGVGFDAPLNIASATAQVSATYPKTIARIDYSGVVNSTTSITDAYSGSDIRSATTTNGTKFWTGGNGGSGVSGVRFTTLGAATTSTPLDNSAANMRYVQITNSQLYVGSQSGAYVGVNKVGTGLPETTIPGQVARIATEANTYGFVFADQSATVPGKDVMYVADGSSGGVAKFSFDGSTWTSRGAVGGVSCYGVYAEDNGATVDVYYTTDDKLYKFTDASAQAGTISGTPVLLYTAPTGAKLRGVSATPQNVLTPDVAHTFVSPATTLTQGSNQAIYSIQIDVMTGPATLSNLTLLTNGTYTTSDITSFKLYRSTDATFDAGDTEFSTATGLYGGADTLEFGSAENFAIGTHYIFVVANVDGCATVGHTVGINNFSLANIEYFTSNSTGSPIASSVYSINAGAPSNVTGLTLASGGTLFDLDWTNPTCFDDILVVADRNPITGTPSGTAYTANADYNGGGGTAFGATGRVVYRGTGESFTLTGLTVGITYYVKVFTRNGTAYSSGVQTSATATNTTLYSRGSGVPSAAIWALTPTGTPATASSLIGGFLPTANVVIQNGNTLQLNTSIEVRDFTVNPGATLVGSGADSNALSYIRLNGAFTNNGTVAKTVIGSYSAALVGLYIDGANVSINTGANAVTELARIRKHFGVATSNLTITGKINLSFSGTTLYVDNNVAGQRMNITIATGAVVTNTKFKGAVALDGDRGQDPLVLGGNLTVNGTLDAGGALYARNNNASGTKLIFTIGAQGIIKADTVIIDKFTPVPSDFNITVGGQLQVRRHLRLLAGDLPNGVMLMSVNGRTASVSALTSQTIGQITYETQLPATPGWRFIAAPVKNKTFGDWVDLNPRLTPKNNSTLFGYTENDSSRAIFNLALTEYNGWKVVNSLGDQINSATRVNGYRLYGRANQKMSITGVPYVGSVAYNATFSPLTGYGGGGWNMVGNPYPSEISWNSLYSFNATPLLTGTVYIWNGTTRSYATFTQGSPGTGTNGGSNTISSGQSFFIKVTNALSVTFTESMKILVSSNNFLREGAEANTLRMHLNFGNQSDEAVIQFRPDANVGLDVALDAYKLPGYNLDLSTVPVAGLSLALNAMPEPTASQVIPVRTDVTTGPGSYSLSFRGLDSFDSDLALYLRDNLLGTVTDLMQTSSYAFTVTGSPTSFRNRFELVVGPQAVTSISKTVKTGLTLYPNPSSGSFTVNASGLKGSSAASLTVIGADGRVAHSATVPVSTSGLVEVPVAAKLATGVYTVRLVVAGQAITEKLVIQ